VTVLVAVFASQNNAVVTVSFFAWSASASLSLTLVIALCAGIALGLFIMLPAVVGGSIKHALAKGKLKRLEKRRSKERGTPKSAKTDGVPAEGAAGEGAEAKPPKGE
jgi:uncharacterized integral membrane protein